MNLLFTQLVKYTNIVIVQMRCSEILVTNTQVYTDFNYFLQVMGYNYCERARTAHNQVQF